MRRLTIDAEALRAMKEHALRDYPHECCGALFGRDRDDAGAPRHVAAAMPIDNVTEEDSRRRFSVAPRDYLRAEREASRLGLQLIGFYHSHPDHPAHPSETDRRYAQPGFSYPILSVTRERVVAITSWYLPGIEGGYEEEGIQDDAKHHPVSLPAGGQLTAPTDNQ